MARDVQRAAWLSQPAGAAWRRGLFVLVALLLTGQAMLAAWWVTRARSFRASRTVVVVSTADATHTVGVADATDRVPVVAPIGTHNRSDVSVPPAVVQSEEPAERRERRDRVAESHSHRANTRSTHTGQARHAASKARRRDKQARPALAPRAAVAAQPPTAQLSIRCDPNAPVFVDGSGRGSTPITGLVLPSGRHRIELRRDGMVPYEADVELKPGETRTIQVVLRQKSERPATAVAKPNSAATAGDQEHVATPAPHVAPPAAPREVPHLPLPASVRIVLYDDGKPTNQLKLVCLAVEKAVTRAMGVSAAGTTRALQNYLLAEHAGEDYLRVKLYPRVMGYLIAQQLSQGKGGIGGLLREAQRAGRLASLTAAGWRP